MRILIKITIFLCLLILLTDIYEYLSSSKIVKILTIIAIFYILYESIEDNDFDDIYNIKYFSN